MPVLAPGDFGIEELAHSISVGLFSELKYILMRVPREAKALLFCFFGYAGFVQQRLMVHIADGWYLDK